MAEFLNARSGFTQLVKNDFFQHTKWGSRDTETVSWEPGILFSYDDETDEYQELGEHLIVEWWMVNMTIRFIAIVKSDQFRVGELHRIDGENLYANMAYEKYLTVADARCHLVDVDSSKLQTETLFEVIASSLETIANNMPTQ